jgi:hypothetical protein
MTRYSYPQELSTGTPNLCTTRRKHAKVIHILASNLTNRLRFTRAREPHRGRARLRVLTLLGALSVFTAASTLPAYSNVVELYKLYAHMKVSNDKQYRCLVTLWTKESNWSPVARNVKSTAFGIPQLLKMKETNPYKQIDLGIKYIDHRYDGNSCKALAAHKRKGFY